jgi:phosphomannomutase
MKARKAILGGEGNGGVIDPNLHYGRDALIGIALVLMHMATSGKSLSQMRQGYPEYFMVKDKISFDPSQSAQAKMDHVASHYKDQSLDVRDGLKIDFPDGWVQLRKSNTEPILRVYSEAKSYERAREMVDQVKSLL